MQFLGTIVSYDDQSGAGLISLEGSLDSVMFFLNDVQFKSRGSLIGRKVTFVVAQTPQGPLAVNILPFGKAAFAPGGVVAAVIALIGAVAMTFALINFGGIDPLLAYVLAINGMTALLVLFGGNLPRNSRITDALLWAFVICGGALAFLLTFSMYFGSFRKDATRFFVAALVVVQVLAVRQFRPEIFTRETLKKLFTLTTGQRPPEPTPPAKNRGFEVDYRGN